MVLCDRFESTVDDFNRSECRKRQSNSYIAIRWNSSQVIIDLSRSNALNRALFLFFSIFFVCGTLGERFILCLFCVWYAGLGSKFWR